MTIARLTACLAPAPDAPAEPRPVALSPSDRAALDRLRGFARRSQLAPPMDLFRACALIDPPPARAAEVWGVALMRVLSRGRRKLSFHPDGARGLTSAEAWLLALLRALAAGDEASARFLVGRWVDRADRRMTLHLCSRLAEALFAPHVQAA